MFAKADIELHMSKIICAIIAQKIVVIALVS